MAWFRLLARGEDFPIVIDEEVVVCGFLTTCFVQAASPAEAEKVASKMLFDDPDLETPPGIENMQSRIYFDEVEQIAAPANMNDGFTFFPMEDEEGEH